MKQKHSPWIDGVFGETESGPYRKVRPKINRVFD